MNIPILVICDEFQEYVNSLVTLFQRRKELPFQVYGFTDKDKLRSFLKDNKIELLLITEKMFETEWVKDTGSKIILLTEKRMTAKESVTCICKYQAADSLYRAVMQAYSEGEKVAPIHMENEKQVKIIGIYSPIHRALQTTLALTMGQVLAEKKKVLYINFECFSGLEHLMGRRFSGNLTDLLYYYKCDKEKILYKLEGMIQELSGLHIIPPAVSYEDYETFQGMEWISVLELIGKVGGYDVLLLDLSEQVRGLFQILERCDRIYTIIKDERMAKAKLAQYELLLKRDNYEDIIAKTAKYELPIFKCLPTELERLNRCELALYAKKMLMEGEVIA
ncbi:MAG: hypothetical protein E7299_01070 [Lachnospiraceae bacterium]|nr:hypothetical protein [Lachnospiraceae bacterium]